MTQQQQQRPLTRLVAANGMKSNEEWTTLNHYGKVVWLASLTDLEVRAQASIGALAGRSTVDAVLGAWVTCGYLSRERAAAVLSAEARR